MHQVCACFDLMSCGMWIVGMRIVFMRALFMQDLTLEEAETIALSILKQVVEEKVSFLWHFRI